ncbi:phage recombination protein Bet [Humidesulfovibrio mexicanus]|uniref:Phage recombination protein Bet n=1 Tax=Humidesulfovibrio mexicanus TaxID=147047 RepID=A0A239AUD4_9BACT|nr:phage recombination protein Bet [Humidesulfovibrio mexicanus]
MAQTVAVVDGTKGALLARMAEKFGVDKAKVGEILKATVFKQPKGKDGPAEEISNEQLAALLIVADQYGLNPFTKEIYAFPDKQKGIVPVIGVDGWNRIMNDHPAMDGIEFRYSETMAKADPDAKDCPEWIEVVIHRKDRSHPIVVREYLDECYRPAFEGQGQRGSYKIKGPWQSHTRRFLRHKALIQGVRIAFGFSGVYDEDEAERIAEARVVNMTRDMPAAIDTRPEPTLDLAALDRFNKQITEALPDEDMDILGEFIAATAAANGTDVNGLKMAAAGDNFGSFLTSFNAWKARRAPEETYLCPDRTDGTRFPASVCAKCPKAARCPEYGPEHAKQNG